MSTETTPPIDDSHRTPLVEVGDRSLSEIRDYAGGKTDVYFERRGGYTFLVANE